MFSFFRRKNEDVFEQRRKRQEVWRHARRLMDSSAPHASSEDDARVFGRENRTLPVLLLPLGEDGPDLARPFYGVTRDFSDQGVSLLLRDEPDFTEGVCAFSATDPLFFAARIRRNEPFGGGFWLLGLDLVELYHLEDPQPLIDLTQALEPQTAPVEA